MKKTYMTPSAEAIKIQTAGMLAVSGFNDTIDSSNPIDSGDMLGNEFTFEEDNFNFSEDNQFSFGE